MIKKPRDIDIPIGHEHLVIQSRYDALGALNDFLIAVWFLIGSFFFLNDSLMQSGTWLFIVGSAQLIIKPAIKLTSLVHLKNIRNNYRRKIPGSNID
ncbi:YrhK family protein [Vibrio sp.]|uniref:YrhK domain-containing protein n=1 Tax=Vibrio viridaestus TaxID=2487322 RepID=A0A3N9THC0_9VIBR|nr:YrhK family protein [Vibrio viridaestus]MDC0611821.1 YrhK family protein [Vibrio sp.]RQW63203.1 hypothetical protein EES38_08095 [Vibrio viridaestus]